MDRFINVSLYLGENNLFDELIDIAGAEVAGTGRTFKNILKDEKGWNADNKDDFDDGRVMLMMIG